MDSGKRGEAADQRQAAAQLNTPRLCLDLVMMCAIKSWRDVGKGVWGACTRMRLQKIWLFFLCMRTHSVAEVCRVGRMLSHVPADSLSLLSRGKKKNHNNINTKRKKKVWLCSRSLSLAVDLEVGGRASRSTALISCPKPSVLANEKRERETIGSDSTVDGQHDHPDSGTPDTSSWVEDPQI